MDLPTSLPAMLYLLAYNLERDRMYPNRNLGRALRAAALTTLLRHGHLEDEGGLVRARTDAGLAAGVEQAAAEAAVGAAGAIGAADGQAERARRPSSTAGRIDPVVTAVLEQVRAAPEPRSWTDWINTDERAAVLETRDDLEAAGWIRVARGQALGVFPVRAVALLDRPAVRTVHRAAGRVLRGEVPVTLADRDLVALVALAAAGDVVALVSVGERKAYADQLNELAALTGPAVPALVAATRGHRLAILRPAR